MRKDDEVVETSSQLVDNAVKEVKVSQKGIPIPIPPPLFPQKLVNKTEDGNYQCFITMLKHLSINVP